MNCVIPKTSLKTLAKAFHALSKVADSVVLESKVDYLLLYAVNSSRSAYGCFQFTRDFFTSYRHGDLKCKVALKSCFLAFKSLSTLNKQVEECRFEAEADRLIVKLHCKYSVVKIFTFPFIESDVLSIKYNRDSCKNKLSAAVKMLHEGVASFLPRVDEVTLIVTDTKVSLKNYTEEEDDHTKIVHTELTIELDEFDNFYVDEQGQVTFCLREFKAILGFAENTGLSVGINFTRPGEVIIFTVNNGLGCECNFVLATLSDSQFDDVGPKVTKQKVKKSRVATAAMQDIDNLETQDEAEEVVPATPPRKRFKDQFLRMPKEGFTSMMPAVQHEILVPPSSDSDSDIPDY